MSFSLANLAIAVLFAVINQSIGIFMVKSGWLDS